jgi:hypothetical protein
MRGAPVELDKRLNGAIASFRERGEFVGKCNGAAPSLRPSGDGLSSEERAAISASLQSA